MPRTRAADGAGRSAAAAEGQILVSGRHQPLSRAAVVRAVERVLRGERRSAVLSLTFLGRDSMRELNALWRGKRSPTDVLAFPLPGPDRRLAGDIYICRWVAAREARTRGISLSRELLRLVIHGVLHVLGHEHPESAERTDSPMWRRQERYLRALS